MSKPHSHYRKSVAHLESVDIYRLLELYGVTDPCRQHAIKKLFCAGQRGGKSEAQDIQEAIDTLKRKLQMLAEDEASPMSATGRASQIAQGKWNPVIGGVRPDGLADAESIIYLLNGTSQESAEHEVGGAPWHKIAKYRLA